VSSMPLGLIVLSTALGASATIPYIAETIRRHTKPRIVTWLTWSLLTAVAGAASASTHDYPSAAFSLIGTVVTAAVVLAGLRYGDRDFALLDAAALTLVAVGLVLWQVLDIPGIAVVAACVIDFIGLVPTLVHSWRAPQEETALTYGLIAAGGVCAALAAWGTWTVTAVAYPIYVAMSMGGCWAIVLVRRPATRVRLAVPPVSEPVAAGDRPRKAQASNRPARRRRSRRYHQRRGRA